jgi:transposase
MNAASTGDGKLCSQAERGQHLAAGSARGLFVCADYLRCRSVQPRDGRALGATAFVVYLKQCLVPILKRGDIVMMDSLPVHKVAGVREVIEAAGAKLRYLPKYSPDLNPIEQAFSKFKGYLRKAAERTIPRLSRRIGAIVTAFSPQECINYFRYAGYAST